MVASDPTIPPQDGSEGGEARRAAKRDSLFLLAVVTDEAGSSRGNARVRNLSETGLMADCELSFRAGDRLVVHLRGVGEVAGAVAWANGNRIGMMFDQRINPQAARKPVTGSTSHQVPEHLRPMSGVPRFRR